MPKTGEQEEKDKKGITPLIFGNGNSWEVYSSLLTYGVHLAFSAVAISFIKSQTLVVWLVKRVTQFPSDMELTRIFTTISEKDLLE